jgi:hypothetical protein
MVSLILHLVLFLEIHGGPTRRVVPLPAAHVIQIHRG